ncbi:hypothetical protein D3C86_1508020 [compost metagenome]
MPDVRSARLMLSVLASVAFMLPYWREFPVRSASPNTFSARSEGHPGNTVRIDSNQIEPGSIGCPARMFALAVWTSSYAVKRLMVSASTGGGGVFSTCIRRSAASSVPLPMRICSSSVDEKRSTRCPRRRIRVSPCQSPGVSTSCTHAPWPLCSSLGE